jgi:hypothetical protein
MTSLRSRTSCQTSACRRRCRSCLKGGSRRGFAARLRRVHRASQPWKASAVLSGLFDLIANALVGALVGAIPERQPWRTLIAALYVLGALAGLGVIVWIIAGIL